MKLKVIVYNKIDQDVKDFLESKCEVHYFESKNPNSLRDNPFFLQELKDTEGLIGSGLRIDRELLEKAPHLKIVSNISVGYDNFDVPALTELKIIATNTPYVLNETTADAIFGLLMATARRIPELDQFVKNGEWTEKLSEHYFGVDVHHKVLGIIGMGSIGSEIAKRAYCGFDMKILYHNRTRNEEAEFKYKAEYCSLDDLLRHSDFVCIMAPLTFETKNSFGEKELSHMKKTAILVVGSRGGIVNEEALTDALDKRTILAAGLDVFEKEPIGPKHRLLKHKNVVTLPHIGSATFETRHRMNRLAAENLLKGLYGEVPPNILNREVLNH